jgi:hypothetical protein
MAQLQANLKHLSLNLSWSDAISLSEAEPSFSDDCTQEIAYSRN